MLKFGYITEVDAAKGRARVKFDGEDGIVSYWLPMAQAKTSPEKFLIPFDVNEHVYCMMDERLEYGVICGAIYDQKNSSTGGNNDKFRLQFVGGLLVEYNRTNNTLAISGPGDFKVDINGTGKGKVNIKCNQAVVESLTDAEVKATTLVKLTAPAVVCSGTLQATAIGVGTSPPGSGNMAITGDMNVTGKVEATEVKEGSIRLGTHKHSGVTTGGGTSGTPVP